MIINVLKGDLTFVGLHRIDLSQLKMAKEKIGNFEEVYEYGRPGIVDLLAFQMKELRFEEIDSETYMWAIYNSNIEYLKKKSLKIDVYGNAKMCRINIRIVHKYEVGTAVCSRSVAKFGEKWQNGLRNPIFADFWI